MYDLRRSVYVFILHQNPHSSDQRTSYLSSTLNEHCWVPVCMWKTFLILVQTATLCWETSLVCFETNNNAKKILFDTCYHTAMICLRLKGPFHLGLRICVRLAGMTGSFGIFNEVLRCG